MFHSVKLLSWDQSRDTTNRAIYQWLKILTVMIRANDRHDECCLNWNVYAALILNFRQTQDQGHTVKHLEKYLQIKARAWSKWQLAVRFACL